MATAAPARLKKAVATEDAPGIPDLPDTLIDMIPDMSWFDDYKSRVWPALPPNYDLEAARKAGKSLPEGHREDLDVLREAHNLGFNALLYGPTGPGKTSMVMAYAARERLPLCTVMCNGAADPSLLLGSPKPMPDGSFKWVEAAPIRVMRHGGVLYLDEFNFLPARIAAVYNSALDARRMVMVTDPDTMEDVPLYLHDECFIIATYNPGYEGTRPLNQALKNRFPIQMEVTYSREVEDRAVYSEQLVRFAEKVRSMAGTLTPLTTNMLFEFEIIAKNIGWKFAVENLLGHFDGSEREGIKQTFDQFAKQIRTDLKSAGVSQTDPSYTI